ncbi:oxygenase MpaB family protein [Kutzneria sp. CA-103260]|uniref:oxygenase MpaB family protein n=1 Tax=Kutzneria sp. CA-103260 TaxID=2802641 RepID=UPI00201313F8|nr:oxygenase MpaB family protein [Kutzneria sp. CA-103260]
MEVLDRELAKVRLWLAGELSGKVAGPNADEVRHRIMATPGPRWFGPDRPIRQVHGDAAIFIGGLRALLLQSLHPLAMAAVDAHSGYRGDPWGRLQRTSAFLATTTYGTAEDATRAVATVRGVHRRVRGTTPDGRPYAASDPHLLEWVHVAEVDSFLRCHQRYGSVPLDEAGADGYVADMARIAVELGVPDPPRSRAELAERLRAFRPELAGTPQARAAARFLIFNAPLPLPARPAYGVLAAASVAMLPGWARWPLRLPYLPLTEATAVRAGGHTLVGALRWIMETPREHA